MWKELKKIVFLKYFEYKADAHTMFFGQKKVKVKFDYSQPSSSRKEIKRRKLKFIKFSFISSNCF